VKTFAFVIFSLCLCADVAHAADTRAVALAKEAEKLYRENKYKEAAAQLSQAYEIEPVPVYLFNIARALDQAGEIDLSLERYRQYVTLSSDLTTPDLVKRSNLAMDRLRTLIAKSVAEKEIRDSEKKRLENDALAARKAAESEAAKAREERKKIELEKQQQAVSESSSRQKRFVAALVIGGVSLASFGTSAAFAFTAGASRMKFREATTVLEKQQLEGATKTQAAITDVALVVGVAAAVAAIVVFPKGPAEQAQVSNVFVIGTEGGAVASVGGRF
jgi:tetratricopeptide (TPR) repeat protein